MPSWTISAPEDFKKSVQETAKKLGLSYGAYLRKAHRAYLETLDDEDFERAKKLMEYREKKDMLGAVRERETIWLREKGHKKKNIDRIKEDLDDPELEKEFLKLIRPREQIADEVLKLHEELNPIGEKLGRISIEELKRRIRRAKARKRARKIKKFCRRCVGNCLECKHYLQDVLDKPVGTGTNQFKERQKG